MKYVKQYYTDPFLSSGICLTVNETPSHAVFFNVSFFNAVFSIVQNTAEIRILPTKELKSECKLHVV